MTTQIAHISELQGRIGEEIAISPWRTVLQEDIDVFAEVTGDQQWIHVDPDRSARESPFGTTVVHGFLTLSLLTEMMTQAIRIDGLKMAINYGFNRVRFTSPVPSGSQLRTRLTLGAYETSDTGIQVTWHCHIECQGHDRPACIAEWLIRYVPVTNH